MSQVLLVWWVASPQEAELQGHARVPGKSFDGQHGVQHFIVSFVQYFHRASQGIFFLFFSFCYLQADFSFSASCLPIQLWEKKKAGATLRNKRQIWCKEGS